MGRHGLPLLATEVSDTLDIPGETSTLMRTKKKLVTPESSHENDADAGVELEELRSDDPEEQRRTEIAHEFRQLQLDADPTPVPPPDDVRRGKYQPKRLPPRIRDGQYIEISSDRSIEMLSDPEPVPNNTRFAAEKLLEALVYVATGKGLVPRTIPVRAERVWVLKHLHAGAADGVRQLFDSDCRHIRDAFTALFGVPPERYWEVVLELALRDALVLRHLLPEQPAIYTQGGVQIGTTPDRPSGARILAIVRDRALPGTVPDYLTSDMIDIALTKCTDGRGGGRGAGKRISVRQWIAGLKKKAEAVRKTRGPKTT